VETPLAVSGPVDDVRRPAIVLAAALAGTLPPAATAQNRPAEALSLGSTLDAATLRDLPASGTVDAILETMQGEAISDRFTSGGLDIGASGRVGAFLGSWAQTRFRLGDVDLTLPDGSGAPFLVPILPLWSRVGVVTGMMPADFGAPGLAVTLEPRRPGQEWTYLAEASASGSGLTATADPGEAPAIAGLTGWTHAGLLAGGPLRPDRLGLVVAGSYSGASQSERGEASEVDGHVGSAFGNLLFTSAAGRDEIQTIGWIQHTRARSTVQSFSSHVQSAWERHFEDGEIWRAFGGYSQRHTTRIDQLPVRPAVERLSDGPVADVVDTGDHRDRRWSAGFRYRSKPFRTGSAAQTLSAGVDVGGAASRVAPGFSGTIDELVDGNPARVWTYASPAVEARRHETLVGAFFTHRIGLPRRLTIDWAVRYDGVSGRADGARDGVSWHSWLPRAAVRWGVSDTGTVSLFAGYGVVADQLPLGLLAFGDPAAPTGTFSRSASSGELVGRVGPGTGGDADFSAVDASLKRPTTTEIVVGAEWRPTRPVALRLAGVAKRQRHLIAVVNSGVPESSYSVFGIVDSIADESNPDAVQTLPVYDRLPSSFGLDQYRLTNPEQDAATFSGLVFDVEARTERLVLLLGATASQTDGPAANRGFHAAENDMSVAGELFANPNAATFARQRLFLDRAYTVKLATVYRFPRRFRLGVVARYQDGQPFSRVVVVPGLNQGTEFIRAYPAGQTRFTYVGTLDVRLQKGFAIGGRALDAIVDAYNVINLGNEVEERTVTGPGFRTITATQPRRAIHLGARLTF
jgi:hypothetical protein